MESAGHGFELKSSLGVLNMTHFKFVDGIMKMVLLLQRRAGLDREMYDVSLNHCLMRLTKTRFKCFKSQSVGRLYNIQNDWTLMAPSRFAAP